jgi:Outer membrane protein beta-barrel domain
MENWENQNFESEWRKAFDGAELTPSASSWESLDARLLHRENVSMKRAILFYQRLAAASVAILLMVGSYAFFVVSNSSKDKSIVHTDGPKINKADSSAVFSGADEGGNSKEIADEYNATLSPAKGNLVRANENLDASITTSKSKEILFETDTKQTRKLAIEGTDSGGQLQGNVRVADVANRNIDNQTSNAVPLEDDGQRNKQINKFRVTYGEVARVNPLPLDALPPIFLPTDYAIAYRLADLRPAVKAKRQAARPDNAWASVGFSAGNFNADTRGSDLVQAGGMSDYTKANLQPLQNDPAASLKEEKIQTGTSLSFMVSAGKRIFKRWVVHGGVNYLNQTSNSTSKIVEVAPANQLVAADANLTGYSIESTRAVTYSTPNEIKSTFQFITVPLQAGYMLVDNKLGLQVNGGLSPDFFLKSTVYDQATRIETVSNASGKNETFNTVSLTGIGGVELSYRFLKHYRVSLAPGFRYSLTSVYKENSLVSAKPLVADIGLRFRYLFNN